MRRHTLTSMLVAAGLLLTGCSGSGDVPSSGTSAGTTPKTSPPAPTARLLTGTQLKALLAPASGFPKGTKLDKKNTVDTGNDFMTVKAPGKQPCSRLNGTAWIDLANVGGVSFAQNDYTAKDQSMYAQEIDAFKGTGAQKVMTNLRAVAKRCRTFTDTQTGGKVKVTTAKAPSIGDDALMVKLKAPGWTGDTTLIAVRVGNCVVTVMVSATKGTGQTMATRLSTYLAKKVRNSIYTSA